MLLHAGCSGETGSELGLRPHPHPLPGSNLRRACSRASASKGSPPAPRTASPDWSKDSLAPAPKERSRRRQGRCLGQCKGQALQRELCSEAGSRLLDGPSEPAPRPLEAAPVTPVGLSCHVMGGPGLAKGQTHGGGEQEEQRPPCPPYNHSHLAPPLHPVLGAPKGYGSPTDALFQGV